MRRVSTRDVETPPRKKRRYKVPLEAHKQIDEIQSYYKKMIGERTSFSSIVMGLRGTGKTTFACTGRLPILLDSFDPLGTMIVHTDPDLVKLYEKGLILVRPFWDERANAPTEFSRWEDQWEEDIASGFIGRFGTYAIDSCSTLIDTISNAIRKRKGRGKDGLAIQDYQVVYNIVKDIVKISSTQGTDFIMTAHLMNQQDELSGEINAEIDTYNRLRSQLPLLFTEKYVLYNEQTSSGVKHVLLTQDDGRFKASTQLGAKGKFEWREEPDLKKLLVKAGLPTEDKPTEWMKGEVE